MRPPAAIVPWMEGEELEQWVDAAPTKATYRRRLAIWWTACGRHAPDVAGLLHTSPRTVRFWIRQFNTSGPTALDSVNLGGRRWGHLAADAERALLAGLRPRARAGRLVTVVEVRPVVEARVGHPVSAAYLYDLLARHGWRKVVPRPRHVQADVAAQEAFKRGSQHSSNA
jgi:transposase